MLYARSGCELFSALEEGLGVAGLGVQSPCSYWGYAEGGSKGAWGQGVKREMMVILEQLVYSCRFLSECEANNNSELRIRPGPIRCSLANSSESFLVGLKEVSHCVDAHGSLCG